MIRKLDIYAFVGAILLSLLSIVLFYQLPSLSEIFNDPIKRMAPCMMLSAVLRTILFAALRIADPLLSELRKLQSHSIKQLTPLTFGNTFSHSLLILVKCILFFVFTDLVLFIHMGTAELKENVLLAVYYNAVLAVLFTSIWISTLRRRHVINRVIFISFASIPAALYILLGSSEYLMRKNVELNYLSLAANPFLILKYQLGSSSDYLLYSKAITGILYCIYFLWQVIGFFLTGYRRPDSCDTRLIVRSAVAPSFLKFIPVQNSPISINTNAISDMLTLQSGVPINQIPLLGYNPQRNHQHPESEGIFRHKEYPADFPANVRDIQGHYTILSLEECGNNLLHVDICSPFLYSSPNRHTLQVERNKINYVIYVDTMCEESYRAVFTSLALASSSAASLTAPAPNGYTVVFVSGDYKNDASLAETTMSSLFPGLNGTYVPCSWGALGGYTLASTHEKTLQSIAVWNAALMCQPNSIIYVDKGADVFSSPSDEFMHSLMSLITQKNLTIVSSYAVGNSFNNTIGLCNIVSSHSYPLSGRVEKLLSIYAVENPERNRPHHIPPCPAKSKHRPLPLAIPTNNLMMVEVTLDSRFGLDCKWVSEKYKLIDSLKAISSSVLVKDIGNQLKFFVDRENLGQFWSMIMVFANEGKIVDFFEKEVVQGPDNASLLKMRHIDLPPWLVGDSKSGVGRASTFWNLNDSVIGPLNLGDDNNYGMTSTKVTIYRLLSYTFEFLFVIPMMVILAVDINEKWTNLGVLSMLFLYHIMEYCEFVNCFPVRKSSAKTYDYFVADVFGILCLSLLSTFIPFLAYSDRFDHYLLSGLGFPFVLSLATIIIDRYLTNYAVFLPYLVLTAIAGVSLMNNDITLVNIGTVIIIAVLLIISIIKCLMCCTVFDKKAVIIFKKMTELHRMNTNHVRFFQVRTKQPMRDCGMRARRDNNRPYEVLEYAEEIRIENSLLTVNQYLMSCLSSWRIFEHKTTKVTQRMVISLCGLFSLDHLLKLPLCSLTQTQWKRIYYLQAFIVKKASIIIPLDSNDIELGEFFYLMADFAHSIYKKGAIGYLSSNGNLEESEPNYLRTCTLNLTGDTPFVFDASFISSEDGYQFKSATTVKVTMVSSPSGTPHQLHQHRCLKEAIPSVWTIEFEPSIDETIHAYPKANLFIRSVFCFLQQHYKWCDNTYHKKLRQFIEYVPAPYTARFTGKASSKETRVLDEMMKRIKQLGKTSRQWIDLIKTFFQNDKPDFFNLPSEFIYQQCRVISFDSNAKFYHKNIIMLLLAIKEFDLHGINLLEMNMDEIFTTLEKSRKKFRKNFELRKADKMKEMEETVRNSELFEEGTLKECVAKMMTLYRKSGFLSMKQVIKLFHLTAKNTTGIELGNIKMTSMWAQDHSTDSSMEQHTQFHDCEIYIKQDTSVNSLNKTLQQYCVMVGHQFHFTLFESIPRNLPKEKNE